MKKSLLTFVVGLAMTSLAFGQRGESGNSSVIVVTGEAQIRVVPDEATVRVGVVRQGATAQAAQEQVNSTANEILAAVTRAGIPSSAIQTSRLNLNPVYAPRGPESNQTPRIVAYQASNSVTVHVSDLTKVGPVIDTALKAGANEIQGVRFGLRDDLPARQQALKMAVNEARKKAEAIAEASGAVLGPPIEIAENGVTLFAQGDMPGGVMMARAPEMTPTPVSPGELEVRANVTIRYRVNGFSRPPQ